MISCFKYEDCFTENCAVPTSVANQDLSRRFQESTWPQYRRSTCQQVATLRLEPSVFLPTGGVCAEISQVYKRYFLLGSTLQSVVPKVFSKAQNLRYLLREQTLSNPHFCDPKRSLKFPKCFLKSSE